MEILLSLLSSRFPSHRVACDIDLHLWNQTTYPHATRSRYALQFTFTWKLLKSTSFCLVSPPPSSFLLYSFPSSFFSSLISFLSRPVPRLRAQGLPSQGVCLFSTPTKTRRPRLPTKFHRKCFHISSSESLFLCCFSCCMLCPLLSLVKLNALGHYHVSKHALW